MSPRLPVRTAFVLLHLDPGGFERVVLNLLTQLDRERVCPSLVLLHGHGALCEQLPSDVTVERLAVRARNAIPALARSLTRLGAEAIFSGTTPANLAALAAAPFVGGRQGIARRPPVVANEHTPPLLYLAELSRPRLYRFLMRHLYPRAARIVVPIAVLGTELREALARPTLPVIELRNPLFDGNLEALASAEPPTPLPPSPVFVAAGRLVAPKGFDVLLRAFAQLRAAPPRAYLVLLGEGPERAPLERLARELGVADRVVLPGAVANPFPYFRRARAVVVSSLREAIPNVLLEAMACGTPVIATECWTGLRAVLDEGRAGLLVPPADPAALAAAMRRLLAEPDLAERLAARGLNRAQEYHVGRTVPMFEALFEELARPACRATDGSQASRPW